MAGDGQRASDAPELLEGPFDGPLVFVHGFPLDHSMWSHQVDAFARVGPVLAPDQRGFGNGPALDERSRNDPRGLAMERLADDLADRLDALRITRPIALVGLSMGGYVAFEFWKRHADRLARLVLCDTRAASDSPDAAAIRLRTADAVERDGVEPFVDGWLARLFAPRTMEEGPPIVGATRSVMSATPRETAAAALRGMAARASYQDRLVRIDVPTLVVCGRHDILTPVAEMRAMAGAMPRARFTEIADAGHMAPLEAPDAVNGAIRAFLEEPF
ncbi:MAG: alpha/beta fold hydrolase [Planctomycetes bacterium]|nr:alpha/beta fold hydrolase [Planctomycetota bacterium]